MTRIGQNPAKLGMQAYQPQRLGMATIVYIPSREGYFRDSLAILKLTLASLRQNTPEPFDLLVFDNGSSPVIQKELVELQQQGVIDWLILAGKNLGKTGAQNWIFSVMPNDWIGYTDSDVLFRKGWLEASREIIAHFPDAGMVGAQPCFFDVLRGKGQAHLRLHSKAGFKIARYTPEVAITTEYCRGVNATPELSAKYHAAELELVRVKKDGFQAGLGASHMQFMIPAELAKRIIPLPYRSGLSQEEDRQLDLRIDQNGKLHLSTLVPYVVHMGNVLDEWVKDLVADAGLESGVWALHDGKARITGRTYGLGWLARHRQSRNWLVRLYNKLFQVLSDK